MKRIPAFILLALLLTYCLPMTGMASESDDKQYIEIAKGEEVTRKGEYTIGYPYALCYKQSSVQEGNYFGYFDSVESGVDTLIWNFPVDTHTPFVVSIQFTNLTNAKVKLITKTKCTVVYDGKYEYKTVTMQINPNQKTSNGREGFSSTVGVPVDPLYAVTLCFFTNVPVMVRDTSRPLVAYISIDDITYSVNLRPILQQD